MSRIYADGTRRPKTHKLLAAAALRPINPQSPEHLGRFKRLEKKGHLRRVPTGWVATGKPYVTERDYRDDTVFDFEAHRRRFRED
ncbi:hypothetical protein [Methylobacterium sp. 285MFTsu5.1]|uniref:hypothetical protein n=1 Tax=Methylobacterium sp. 285MFTsu5.1 TaxID=1172187 RepID=UPI0003728ABA|nr:hypothetical protein [Methylobacterium sp. 285MFTsu5.1]